MVRCRLLIRRNLALSPLLRYRATLHKKLFYVKLSWNITRQVYLSRFPFAVRRLTSVYSLAWRKLRLITWYNDFGVTGYKELAAYALCIHNPLETHFNPKLVILLLISYNSFSLNKARNMSYFFKVNEINPRQNWYTTPKFSPTKSQQVSAWLSLKTDATVNYYYTKQLDEIKSLNITYQTLTTRSAGLVGATMLSNKKPPILLTQYLSLLLNTSSQLTNLYRVNIYLVLRQCLC